MTFKTPEDADRFFKRMEAMSRQMAHIFGEESEAYKAVTKFDAERAQGSDVVILFTEHLWVTGPRPGWDTLNGGA